MFSIVGIETLSSSIRANVECLKLVQENNVYLIVDESNLVKNHKAKRTQNIMRLSENCSYKLILNGTPISRNEADLFSQWQILDWRILGYRSYWSFSLNHIEWDERVRGKIKRTLNVDYLVRKITPYTYQVKKEEC
ncbi:SNF2-related protein, partial [Streptococcus sobrinus]|uniref:SNF2-related protein n=1 Tax=Streptococcus sobrinus TaxID=1310 RepID=UPI002100545A